MQEKVIYIDVDTVTFSGVVASQERQLVLVKINNFYFVTHYNKK